MSLLKDLDELVTANILSKEKADEIRTFFEEKKNGNPKLLYIVFGILGAILVGMGIILMIAHNWDNLSKSFKTFLSLLPLIIGQSMCGYSLIKKTGNSAWKESSSAFLFFAIGAGISLVSQIYHIPGDLSSYLFTWSLLALPIVYVMNSSTTSLLFIVIITYYAVNRGYWNYPNEHTHYYWLLLLMILPHYFRIYRKKPLGNFMTFHNWIVPLSLVIVLGTTSDNYGQLISVGYMSMFGLFYLIANLDFFKTQKNGRQGYRFFGSFGSILVLLILSFKWFWLDLQNKDYLTLEIFASQEIIISALFTLSALFLWYRLKPYKQKNFIYTPLSSSFLVFVFVFFLGLFSSIAVIIINLLILAIGILTIIRGAKLNHLGIMNYGLLIITALVICRFFDTELTFVIRGLMFLAVGVGFFLANYLTIKKRMKNEV